MTPPPKVSVILPAYNRARFLRRSVGSVLTQSYPNFELIVVDDASTDDTYATVKSLCDPRLRYLSHEVRKGGAAARNTGIAAARGTFVAFQDSDDEWLPNKLGKQVGILEQEAPSVGAVYCAMLRRDWDRDGRIPGPHVALREGDLSRALLYENFIGTPALLVRRECLRKVGSFWPELPRFQDWELVLRLSQSCEFRFLDEALVLVHGAPGNISNDPQAATDALERILERHGAEFQTNPRALARLYRSLGIFCCLSGKPEDGRRWLFRSLRADPTEIAAWASVLLSFGGASAVHSAQVLRGRLGRRRRG